MIKVTINDRTYSVNVAETEEEKEQGLQNETELPQDSGLLFVYDKPQEVSFWMQDTLIPLDIVFIDEYEEVISVAHGNPLDPTPITEDGVSYVLEVNAESGIKAGDEVEIDETHEAKEMQVLAPDGSTQMTIEGGERIFSRKNTKALIKLAKKAQMSQEEKDFKALGKRVFKYIDTQESNSPEFVEK